MYKSAQLDTKRDHLYIEWRPSAGHMAISRAAFQALARGRLMPLGPAETPLMFCYLENPLLLLVLSPGVSFLLPLSSSGTQGASAHTHTPASPFIGCQADPSEAAGGCHAWLGFQRYGSRHNGCHLVQPLPLNLTLTSRLHSLQYGSSLNSFPRMHFVSLSPTCVLKRHSLTTCVSYYHKNVYY